MYIESYSHSTSQLNAMAGALFAGSAFLAVRAAGVINDENVPDQKWPWLPVVVMVLAAVSMMLGYFVYERTAFFYSTVYQLSYLKPETGNMPDVSNHVSEIFDNEIRYRSLNLIVRGQVSAVILAGVALVSWFIFNVRNKK